MTLIPLTKTLIVEDSVDWAEMATKIIRIYAPASTVVWCQTVQEAEKAVADGFQDFDLVLMDACVPGHQPNTQALVRQIRHSWKGPMVAISSDEDFNRELVGAGCSDTCRKHSSFFDVLFGDILPRYFKRG